MHRAPRRRRVRAVAVIDRRSPPGEVALRTERDFLALCLASGDLGRDYLGRAADEHLSSELSQARRTHLVAHFDDPLVGLPDGDPDLAAPRERPSRTGRRTSAHRASPRCGELPRTGAPPIEREIRRAAQAGDHTRMTELAAADQRVRDEMGAVTGQLA